MANTRKQNAPRPGSLARPLDPWISVKEAARVLGIAPQTVHARISAGALEKLLAGGRTHVSRASVAALKAAMAKDARSVAV